MSGVYSFLNVVATIVGPGGSFPLGSTAGAADEGITITHTGDKGSVTVGADGQVMHTMHADKSGTLRLRLLKTSQTNALLNAMYILQTSNPANYGQNIIEVLDINRGDGVTCNFVGFAKRPDLTYAKTAGMIEWLFNVGEINYVLGVGLPDVNSL